MATYHIVGAAGVGMSALAEILLRRGDAVSGSDRLHERGVPVPALEALCGQGMRLVPQDGSGVRAGLDAVVVSTAIEADNPDRAAALRAGVAVRHRSELLADLTRGRECVAVAGTCGKSTVTGMLGWILAELGADPTVVNGAPLTDWVGARATGSTRLGQGRLMVLEADESDRSLLTLEPEWAVITNMSADHFDMEETRRVFDAFKQRVRRCCLDRSGREWRPEAPLRTGAWGSEFLHRGTWFRAALPGRHNIENAVSAIELSLALGYEPAAIRDALASFRGIRRRLERVGAGGGVTVFDDYAHNPAKIRAAWTTLHELFARVHCIWRPHGYGPLRNMLDGLAGVFGDIADAGDRAILLPVYDMGGTADRSVTTEDLLRAVGPRSGARRESVLAVDGFDACREILLDGLKPGEAVVCMGARDVGLPVFCRELVRQLGA